MKQQSFKSILLALAVLLGAAACKKDPDPEPNPGQPQQQLPNPLPDHALVSNLKWSDTDHYTFTYNAKNQVSNLHHQWQFVQGDPTQIRTLVYDFLYDAQDKPVQVDYSGGYSAKYFYHNNLIEKTQELYPGGAVAKEVTYVYANNRIAQEIWEVPGLPGEPVSVYKYDFEYDSKGNLAEVETYEQVTDSTSGQQQYKLLETAEYSDFDEKINPTSWMLRYPYLPQVRWQFNNPQREIRRSPDGATIETIMHEYEYNDEGLPVVKKTTRPSGVLTMTYIY